MFAPFFLHFPGPMESATNYDELKDAIARAYADTRVSRIYGGTSEIMKEVIARSMGLGK